MKFSMTLLVIVLAALLIGVKNAPTTSDEDTEIEDYFAEFLSACMTESTNLPVFKNNAVPTFVPEEKLDFDNENLNESKETTEDYVKPTEDYDIPEKWNTNVETITSLPTTPESDEIFESTTDRAV